MTVFIRRLLRFVVIIVWLIVPGCTTTTLFSKFTQKGHPKATATDPAVRCLCLWEPAEGTGVDNKPARGVSGQVFFFTRNGASSVEVDGDARVFLFDNQGSAEEQAQPLHQFEFLGGTWKTYLTSTQFGPAYQLFIPYPRKGRHQAELALRVRLNQPSGAAVYSDIAKVVLTGYDRAIAKGEAESPKSDSDELASADAQSHAIPQQIEQTLRNVLSKRTSRGQPPQNSELAEESVLRQQSRNPPILNSAVPDPLLGGEFSLSDRPIDRGPHSRVRLRQAARNREQPAAEDED